ncbi:hypothetical protein PMI24_00164 [Pseudomonas sp. GM25]|nr:hypothetical protein PMI24_00164 [Pseudomonas sp. GM25]
MLGYVHMQKASLQIPGFFFVCRYQPAKGDLMSEADEMV